MKIAYSKIVLSLLFASSLSVTSFAAESIAKVSDEMTDSDHSYETVVHEDEEKEGLGLLGSRLS